MDILTMPRGAFLREVGPIITTSTTVSTLTTKRLLVQPLSDLIAVRNKWNSTQRIPHGLEVTLYTLGRSAIPLLCPLLTLWIQCLYQMAATGPNSLFILMPLRGTT